MTDEAMRRHVEEWRRETAARADDPQGFLSWFNASRDPAEDAASGWWDFSFHILKPRLLPLLGEPFGKTALEIGYGAGRLLAPACRFFRECVGLDIHDHREKVEGLLASRNVTNFRLFRTDGLAMPLPDASVDFAYSYIVLQHLPHLEALRTCLAETRRVLRRGAPAILYMGWLPGLFSKRHSDAAMEKPDSVRRVTLRLSIPLGRDLLREAGLRVVETARAQKRPWLPREYGNQFYAVVVKR